VAPSFRVRHRFDQLGKKIGLEALGPSGLTVAHDEISPDAHHADLRHEPDPARGVERARLGLLGRIASILCLIEIYSGAPDEDETLACLGKLIAFRQKRRRDARKKKPKRTRAPALFIRPFVWIIAAGRPTAVLSGLASVRAPGWPRGVYFSPGVLADAGGEPRTEGLDGAGGLLRAGIVVANELPRDRSTLLVRLMTAGPLLAEAIADLSALPEDAHEHAVASQILLGLHHALGKLAKRTPEEQEFIVSMQNIAEKLKEEGRKEGHGEGRLAQARAAVRRVLALRKLATSPADEARIDACADLAMLERWLDQGLAAQSAAEALHGGSGGLTPARRRRTARS